VRVARPEPICTTDKATLIVRRDSLVAARH